MYDAIVVGGGIIGSTITLALRKSRAKVLLLDDGRPMAGTGPSGGHLKPSWFASMQKEESESAMELLDDVWGLIERKFTIWPKQIQETVWRVDTDKVVSIPKTKAKASKIKTSEEHPVVYCTDGSEYQGRLLVLATGCWIGELAKAIKATPKQGVSFRLSGQISPFIKPWAPYKQIVAHQQGPQEIWIGDGSALLHANWTQVRTKQCLDRCQEALPAPLPLLKTKLGLRPYCKKNGSDPCLMESIGPRTWAVTGAGKLGTIAAGFAARKLLDVL